MQMALINKIIYPAVTNCPGVEHAVPTASENKSTQNTAKTRSHLRMVLGAIDRKGKGRRMSDPDPVLLFGPSEAIKQCEHPRAPKRAPQVPPLAAASHGYPQVLF